MELYYYAMKVFLLGALIRAFVMAEPLKKHVIAISAVYTLLVAFLSYVFLLSQSMQPNFELWKYWLGMNFLLTWVYFTLLGKFDESALFWLILPLAVVLIFNEPNLVPLWLQLIQSPFRQGNAVPNPRR